MSQPNRNAYYAARAAASRALAHRAASPAAAAIHAELAARYDILAAQPEPQGDAMSTPIMAWAV